MFHTCWLEVDVRKRADRVRSRRMPLVLKELVANALDAGATDISMDCRPVPRSKPDKRGLKAYTVTITDDGAGCDDPEILRTVGSTTSDLHRELRGRFGHGLIDFICLCETVEIVTLRNRLVFDAKGCDVNVKRKAFPGLTLTATFRHDGEGFDDLARYFACLILPDGVKFSFNGAAVERGTVHKVVEDVKVTTEWYDAEKGKPIRRKHKTDVVVRRQYGDRPMIHELGIPVDEMPWSLPYDVNVLQKTPLDTERDMLPQSYKDDLLRQMIAGMNDEYGDEMDETEEVPDEIAGSEENFGSLDERTQFKAAATQTGVDPSKVARRNPFDEHDPSESADIEAKGWYPKNIRDFPRGVRGFFRNNPTVADTHDGTCKLPTKAGKLPPETPRQRTVLATYAELATALVEQNVQCARFRGSGACAGYRDGRIAFNIDERCFWSDPLGEEALGILVHECAHASVSGHGVQHDDATCRLGARLGLWIERNPNRFAEMRAALNGESE